MDRKEFTFSDADQLDYAYRLPLYSTMELFIETLTGTCFELRVSPYETVISVKAKIQRLEGIPIGQQYLIWHDMELEDDYCLHDYNITDGCTLKLVLAMRGGPINTRRIAMEDPSMREMADYVESNQEELFDKLSPPPSGGNSNKQVTLLVYRDGDQLNFFRVVDRGDGTLTPFTDSLSGSACNLREDEDDTEEESSLAMQSQSPGQQPLSVAQMVENNITASKMKQLRSHLQNLNIGSSKHPKQTPEMKLSKHSVPRPPVFPRTDTVKSNKMKSASQRKELIEKLKASISEKSKLSPSTCKDQEPVSTKAVPSNDKFSFEDCAGNLRSTSISRTELLRARLKRSKNVVESQEDEKTETPLQITHEKHAPEPTSPKEAAKPSTLEQSDSKKLPEQNGTNKPQDAESSDGKAESCGRFSPRTRRLLNALEGNSPQNKPSKPAPPKTSPRSSSLLQGLTYNRHDLYLRSYGLIASPEEDTEEQVISPASPPSAPPKEEPPALAPQVFETAHGVKYSSVGNSLAPYYWGGRFLKSPSAMGEPFEARDTVPTSSVWHPSQTSHTSKRASIDADEIPGKFVASRPVPSFSTPAKTIQSGKDGQALKKLDTKLTPQPPPPQSVRSSAASATWQKQRLKRMNSKPLQDSGPGQNTIGTDSRSITGVNELPSTLSSPRRPLREVSSKSGLRMKESPHGKVESMSRQEAREVVDLINKAMDASILRTFVRSPVKDGQRGNSGQSSGRHRTTLQHHGIDGGRSMLKSSHGNHASNSTLPPPLGGASSRGPTILPPVKQRSKKKRCFHCAKRTGLASSYICRCGNNFCATHRYAETHDCTYDYKTAGRKLLEEANPLVSAPKLPKI
uniref:AN1-type zinc finger protein 4 n=1 Tax=Phallusia mammillata TaxID=59560 RepID=A0A6F9DY17_9ASCI|nr:AN1-type zinc finger protein 4 [Phallusia mammillata]